MSSFILSFVAVTFISLISLVGVFAMNLKDVFIKKTILIAVAFAAGSLLGASFFDILPEAVEKGGAGIFSYVLAGMLIFFVMERYIHWHHCHSGNCEEKHHHPMTYMNLIGDAMHNFIDGALVAAAFISGVPLGIVTTFAIAMHEIPQEISDFAILIHGGFSKKKALLFNFISSFASFFGVIAIFLFAGKTESFIPIILAIAGGGFIYLATADLIPEIHKETKRINIILQSGALILGVLIVALMKQIFPE